MRYRMVLTGAFIMHFCAVAWAGDDISAKMCSLLLEGNFSQAVVVGERLMASYKENRPPLELYYYLFLAYSNLGKGMRARDINRIMEEEYNYHLPVERKVFLPPDQAEVYQVGAFRKRVNAEHLVERLRKRGIWGKVLFDSGLYKVRVVCKADCDTVLSKIKSLNLSFRKVKE